MTAQHEISGEAMLDALLETAPATILRGEAASAAGRALLQNAGLDTDAFLAQASKGGRPRLDGGPTGQGARAPRVNVSIPPDIDERLEERAAQTGVSRSQLVRQALAAYLAAS